MARYTIEEGKSTRIASLPPSTVLTPGKSHNPRSCKWACTCVVLHASTALAFSYVGKATKLASAETFGLHCSQESRKTQRLDSGTEQYNDGKKPADEDDTACTARTTDGGEPDCRAHRFTMMLWSNKRLAGVMVVADSTGTSWASTKFRSLSTRQVPSHDLSPSRQARELQLRSSATATTTQLLTSRHHHSHG
jgi:hypothetical protein